MRAPAAAASVLLAVLVLASGTSGAVAPIVEGDYTSLRMYCDARIDGKALQGDGADDAIGGSGARDLLRGGGGDDRLSGRGGGDCLQAQSGDDRVRAGPGKDTVSCGSGRDTAIVDQRDDVARDCERVRAL